MSISVQYSKFGTIFSDTSLEALRGEPGAGFALDEFGNYDIQGNSMVDIDDLDVRGVISNDTPADVGFGSNIDMNGNNIVDLDSITVTNDIIYSAPETNNTLTTVLARDSADGNKIKETDLSNFALNDIDVNEINQKDNGFIKVNDDTVFRGSKIKISDTVDASTAVCQLHIQDEGNSTIFLEADSNNQLESDKAYLLMSGDGNQTAMELGSASSGGNNDHRIRWGFADLDFVHSATVTNNGTGLEPSFSGTQTPVMTLKSGEVDILLPLDMNSQNVNNVATISVNDINVNSDAEIKINNDTVITSNSVKFTSVAGQNSITATDCFHIQSNEDACLFLQADRNDTGGTDNPLILANTAGGEFGTAMLISNTVGAFQLASGSTADATSGIIQFYTTQITDNGDAPFDFTGSSKLFEMNDTINTSNRNLSLNTNDLSSVGTITADNAVLSSIANDDTATKLLVLDGSNNVDYRNVSSLPTVNPFDQTLNIADDVVLGDVVARGQIKVMNGVTDNTVYTDGLHITSNSTAELYLEGNKDEVGTDKTNIIGYTKNVTASAQRGFLIGHGTTNTMRFIAGNDAAQNNADFLFSSAQTFDNGDFIPTFGSETNIMRLQTSAVTSYAPLDMNNNNVNNVNTLAFQTTPANDDTENRLLVLNTADDAVEYRNVSSLPFASSNQALDTTDNVTFNKVDITNPTLNNSSFSFAMYNATSDEIEYRTDFADQSVNIGDNVEFADVQLSTITGITSAPFGAPVTLSADSSNLSINSSTELEINGYILLDQAPAEPTVAPTNSHKLYTRLGTVKVKDDTNTEYDIINPVFGQNWEFAESLGVSTTSSTSYQSKLSLTTATLPIGTYKATFQCRAYNSNTTNTTAIRLRVDAGAVLNAELFTATRPEASGTWQPITEEKIFTTVSAATHALAIDYKSLSAGTANITKAQVSIFRVA